MAARSQWIIMLTLGILSAPAAVEAQQEKSQQNQPPLEVTTSTETVIGRCVAFDQRHFWLEHRDGKLQEIAVEDVTGFRPLEKPLRPMSAAELRTRLQVEFGTEYEVKGTANYLVCALKGHAEKYVETLDQMYRDVYHYFSVRNFPVAPLERPLVAIIFPSQERFEEYARQDGVQQFQGLAGYYQMQTNRVALFDPTTAVASSDVVHSVSGGLWGRPAGVDGGVQTTLIHEATHQVAFNLGLHSRLGQTPRWLVEGLAMVFEHPDSRGSQSASTAKSRINRERYLWFGNYKVNRRQGKTLAELVQSDQLFQTQTFDAYSEAWALSFFLLETRSSSYSKYLQLVTTRPPLANYSPLQRLEDFRSAFGDDLNRLEVEFLRFIDRL